MDKNLVISPVSAWGVFPTARPYIISGPCSAESEEQVMDTAKALGKLGIDVFRAGIWKPRTRPGCFEGVGAEGLPWLSRVRNELGMKVCTEVAGASHVKAVLENGIDMVWIGARTTANPFLVQEIAEALSGTDIPVLVKNPVNPDPDLWIGAIERLQRCGVTKIAVIHRGFSPLSHIRYRNSPEWHLAVNFRSRFPEIPFFCDPSHMGGSAAFVREISQKALDLGLDGLMIEAHRKPCEALSDASQQLSPDELKDLLAGLKVRMEDTDETGYRSAMDELRSRIDVLDEELLETLASRMELSREIGRIKKASNVAIIQTSRWESIISRITDSAKALKLDPTAVRAIFENIHQASIQEQNQILEDNDSTNEERTH